MGQLGRLVRVQSVDPRQGYHVHIFFEDGAEKVIDLEPYLRGPIFDPLRRDMVKFRAMKVEGGTITWDNGADIDPDVLYYGLAPAWMEEPTPAELVPA
jgi:hypothetical protein